MATAGYDSPSEYELKRLENINKNFEFMEKCGELKQYVLCQQVESFSFSQLVFSVLTFYLCIKRTINNLLFFHN